MIAGQSTNYVTQLLLITKAEQSLSVSQYSLVSTSRKCRRSSREAPRRTGTGYAATVLDCQISLLYVNMPFQVHLLGLYSSDEEEEEM